MAPRRARSSECRDHLTGAARGPASLLSALRSPLRFTAAAPFAEIRGADPRQVVERNFPVPFGGGNGSTGGLYPAPNITEHDRTPAGPLTGL